MGQNNITFSTEDFSITKVNDAFADISIKNINTGEYTPTGVNLLFDDIEFSSRVNKAIADIADIASSANEVEAPNYDDVVGKLKESPKLSDDNKKVLESLLSMQCELFKIQAVSEAARNKFDEAMGEGSLDKFVQARFGRTFLPNVIFTGSLLSFLSNAGSAMIAKELTATLNGINERFKDV